MTSFPSIRIEGGLLGPDVIEQLVTADLPGQKPADFGLEGRRNLTDEIAAVFADSRTLWGVFQNRLSRLPDGDIATSVTRDAWVIPFLGLLGFEPRFNQRSYDVEGLSFAISHRIGEAEDSPPVHIVGVGQELGRVPASGRPRLAPHSLVQEYLNRTEHVWGLVTNGITLRLLRDSTFIRRQAYIEFDLRTIIDEQRFQDFAVLYRLIHRTRLPRGLADASECFLELYYTRSVEQGGRVREHLRDGVEECIKRLANGFLSCSANEDLQRRVSSGQSNNERISPVELYRQLLRIVYRFLFLLVSEDRGLLSPDPVYREHYGIARLRRMLDSRASFTDHDDVWRSLQVLWKVLGDDKLASFLQLAPLNGELFTPQDLDAFSISNHDLLDAFWYLAWYQESQSAPPRRVNYAALDVEELGSVYESLLEFHPHVDTSNPGRPVFQLITGSERKTTGSYYTPPQLVNELIQSALDPVIKDRLEARPNEKEKALLSIRVCDPACGSGHFLLAAARRLGKELTRVRTGEDEPAPERVRESTRDVISHCIYGVDRNPLAVDLCRVALWLESHTGGKPLTFLDHRIRCGDSLIGVYDLEVLKEGIPDKAFDALEGDDKAAARAFAKRNSEERVGEDDLFAWEDSVSISDFSAHSREIDSIADDNPETIRRKKQLFEKSHSDASWRRQKVACDLWTASFYQPLKPDTYPITSGLLAEHLSGQPIDPRVKARVEVIALKQAFFHWPLEFPEVFADREGSAAGFDVVLSNPPWEHVELKEQEYFAVYDPRIANAKTKATRTKLIKELTTNNAALHARYVDALRAVDASRLFLANSGRYPLTARGRINTYAVFAELSRIVIGPAGRSGIIVPSGIATDDTTKFFFQDIAQSGALVSLYDFENRKGIFPAVHRMYKFCLLTCRSKGRGDPAVFVFFALDAGDLKKADKRFALTADEIALLNPNTGNCPIFRTQADAELTKAIYRRVPVLWREEADDHPEQNPWKLKFSQGLFNMAADSHHFKTAIELKTDGYRREGNIFTSPYDRYLPLYEAKMVHQFDHRWATYENDEDARDVTLDEKRDPSIVVQPRYWVREEVVESTIPKYPEPLGVALQLKHLPSIQRVLCLWVAGYHLNRDNKHKASRLLDNAVVYRVEKAVASFLTLGSAEDYAAAMETDFPLLDEDIRRIETELHAPESVAAELVERFSPKWFLGWRDITNASNERTTVSSVIPKAAVGDTFLLMFSPLTTPNSKLALVANLNSFVQDYAARQKVGGTHMKYNVFRQLAVLPPKGYESSIIWDKKEIVREWVSSRALELVYSAHALRPVAHDCNYDGPPFRWDHDRRFEIRCELDAAFFHLYLPSESSGDWQLAENETPKQMAALKQHFLTPRHAVAYILDQFPITKKKDEEAHGRYKTKERILEIYDAMLEAQRSDRPFQSSLNPPPGVSRK